VSSMISAAARGKEKRKGGEGGGMLLNSGSQRSSNVFEKAIDAT